MIVRRSTCMLLLLLALAVAACTPQGSSATNDRDAVLAYSEAKTDNLLRALNDGDYQAFSRDFHQDMLNSIPEENFAATRERILTTIGPYISREVADMLWKAPNVVVTYNAQFGTDENVTIMVSFQIAAPNKVTGLWFQSDTPEP